MWGVGDTGGLIIGGHARVAGGRVSSSEAVIGAWNQREEGWGRASLEQWATDGAVQQNIASTQT